MEFEQKNKRNLNEKNYHFENLKISRDFSKQLLLEMKDLVRSIVLFGSNSQNTAKKDSDIDIMIVLDNVSVFVTPELREAYTLITNNLSKKLNNKLHIMTINLTDLWDMARKGDPVLINILRTGLPLFDRDLIEPLAYLLEIGKIKPSRETVYNYMQRSETLFNETNHHLEEAILDLYYSVVDMIHSTLIIQKIMPISPKEMPENFKKVFENNPKLLKNSLIIEEIYEVAKKIEHKEIDLTGNLYDKLKKKSSKLITELKKFNLEEMKKKDIFEF